MNKESRKKAVILGAGITGLKTAVELAHAGYSVIVLEKEMCAGGMSKSFTYKEYILDEGPHKFYSQIKGIMPEYKELLGEECLTVKKSNSLFLLGTYFHFPPRPLQLITCISPIIMVKTGLSYSHAVLTNLMHPKENKSYEDYFINGFGKQGYELLFKGLCEKVWGDPKIISEELARRRIPVPNIKDLIKNVISGAKERPDVSAEYFYYPKKGFGEFTYILLTVLKEYHGEIIYHATPTKIVTKDNQITSLTYLDKEGIKKEIHDIDILISTILLKDLVSLMHPHAPQEVLTSAENLKYRALILSYVFLNKKNALQDNWYFYPESSVCFNRVSEQKSFSPYTAPDDQTVITIEISCDEDSAFYNKSEKEIQEVVVNDLKKTHVLKKEEIIEFIVKKRRNIYPVYSVGFRDYLKIIITYLNTFENIYSIGRQGLFNYNNADHCIDMVNKTAKHILLNGTREEWNTILAVFDTYKIVD